MTDALTRRMSKTSKVIINKEYITSLLQNVEGFEAVLQKMKIICLGEGNCTAELQIDKEHTNRRGGLHGGLSATIVDAVTTYALLSHEKAYGIPTVSVDLNLTYMQGAMCGEQIWINAETLKAGGSLAFTSCEILNKETQHLLVRGAHTKFIMRPKK